MLTFTEHQSSQGDRVPLIKEWKDIINKVGDNQVLLQSIKGSPYYSNFGDRALVWEKKLSDLDEVLHNLNTAQRKWVYLEPYQEQMKINQNYAGGFNYKEVFKRIDDDFRMVMDHAKKDSRVTSILKVGSIKSILVSMLERLDRCQKSLNDFLEEKRSSFPRFYFIGDDDLLQILGQATKPEIIQTHLKKLFAGIHSVNFDKDGKNIMSMNSLQGEIVTLKNPIRITPEVETWMSHLASEMKNTLRILLVECLTELRKDSGNLDPLKYPSQILCLAEAINFSEKCEFSIRNGNLDQYLNDLKLQLESYTSVSLDGDDESVVLQLKLKALVLDLIHYIDIVEHLVREKVKDTNHWMWQKQLRFYYVNNETVIKMVDAEFIYTFEYQGNAPKLVHTPLTDKCYLTLTQGMKLGLGGNPYGPAGTGKTESVKALGGLFGRQVLVFNCDEGIDIKSMGRIFIGLVKCGAWGCFDEFNRLEEMTLSAVSMQIQPIQTALKHNLSTVVLLDKETSIDPNSGIFVTMNPAGKQYGGRQKLPDNLKQLFRPVVMSKPDNEIIAEVSLFSEGFKNAKEIGKKLVGLFTVANKLLTPQQHYDWGLRALIPVLKGCGTMLKIIRQSRKDYKIDSEKETEIAVNALRLNTVSKLTFGDIAKFDQLVQDFFPGIQFSSEGYEQLEEALKVSCDEIGLDINSKQIRKAIELFEQLKQRMGVVIVGPSGSGKTTLITLLKHALNKLGVKVKQQTINPKAISRPQLLGHIDLDTREWTNGVLTLAALQAVDEPLETTTWIVCDGDVDPEWVESLNSVLDENRLLTLPSGWRIQFGPNVNFIFETHDLTYASPATISRMAMIFLSNEDTNITGVVNTWLKKQPEGKQEFLRQLINEMFYKAVDWCIAVNEFVVETSLVGTVLNGLSQLTAHIESRLEFAILLFRGLGGNLMVTSKDLLAREILGWCGETLPSRYPSCIFYNKKRDKLDSYSNEMNSDFDIHSLNNESLPIIFTADVQLSLDCIMPWLTDEKQPFLLVGPEGCGKSMILQQCFNKLRGCSVATVHCSANITPEHVIDKLAQVCLTVSSSNGRVYTPKECDRLILYFKDLNLAMPDKYGTSRLVSFLQQILTYQGFYDKNNEWVGLEHMQVVGSMTAGSSLGKYSLTTRFTSIIRTLVVQEPDKDQLETIYSSYLYVMLKELVPGHPVWANPSKVAALACSTVKIFLQLKESFSVDEYCHYIFTSRDITRWCTALMRYKINDSENSQNFILLIWSHECIRLFRDKLVNEKHRTKFDSIVSGVMLSDWNCNVLDQVLNMYFSFSGLGESPQTPMPIFGRQLCYTDKDIWKSTVEKGKSIFSRENWQPTLYNTKELLDMCARCDRVLSMPGGALLLAGRSGAGRRTAISVTSSLLEAKLITLKMGKTYGIKQFKSDLKTAMQASGVDNDQVVLIIEDFNIIDDQFLDLINSLLSSGEIPGLYSPEELEPLLQPLKQLAGNSGFSGDLTKFYAQNVKRNLHIVLILDCSDEKFSAICESNPAFLKECSIQWISDWSIETLKILPHEIITIHESSKTDKKLDLGKEKQMHVSDAISQAFSTIHDSIESSQASPAKFVRLINSYISVFETKKCTLQERMKKLSVGVSKLNDAREVVSKLKKEAATKEKELAEKQAAANDALQMITDTMKNANTQRNEMQGLRSNVMIEEREIAEKKKIIDAELKEIEPMIEEAKKAIGSIKNETLTEIRSLRMPPEVIRDILEATLILMGIQDTSWNSMKSFLSKRGIREEIRAFDPRSINSKARSQVETILDTRKSSFTKEAASRASAAAVPLAAWVSANVRYSYVLEKIKPLEQEQSRLHSNLKLAENQLSDLTQGLSEVDQKVTVLKQKLSQFTKEAAEVEISLTKTQEIIASADKLVAGLEGEYLRWKREVEVIGQNIEKIPHQAIITAGFLTYLADMSEDLRMELSTKWSSKLGISKFDIKYFVCTEQEMLQWRAEGLPSDELSLENAIAILKNSAIPYIIDPSSQATEWLKKHYEKEGNMEVISMNDEKFFLSLELSVRFGKTLVVLDVDNIPPILYPILRKDIIGQGPYKVVQIGEKQVDFSSNFKLFLVTNNPKPSLSNDGRSLTCVVNFTTTRAGLTGQLLAKALKNERPELEERKSQLLKQEEELKIQISDLEDELLNQLANSSGNILENRELLDSLNETKTKSAVIEVSLTESEHLQNSFEVEANKYIPLAVFASKLFFSLTDLPKINNMYQFSLAAFLQLYEKIFTSVSDGNVDLRLEKLKKSLLKLVYEYASRSLFKSDRLAFGLHLLHSMNPELFLMSEWEFFTGLYVDSTVGNEDVNISLPSWIDEERRKYIIKLGRVLPDLFTQLHLEDTSSWNAFMKSEECDKSPPAHCEKKLSIFQQVLLVQALRPDRLESAMEYFLLRGLNMKELSPPALNLREIVKETNSTEPILMINLPGSDPSQELCNVTLQNRQYLHEISMGQGQTDYALEKLREAMKHGQWICLKNIHLMTYWIPVLVKELKMNEIHKDFRLWLTAEPHPKFPTEMLESCLKITYESPPGVKRNLQTTLNSWNSEFMSRGGNTVRAQALFTLAWFHAIVQERRKFIPQGWANYYEFSDADLRTGVEVLENLFKHVDGSFSWDYVHGLFRNAIYGGRIDNNHDLRIMESYLSSFFNSNILAGTNRAKRPLGPGIELPSSFSYDEYVELVHRIPETDKPAFFGLPANIERTYQRNVSESVLKQLRMIVLSTESVFKFEKEKWQVELTPILNLWKKLNQGTGILQLKIQQPNGQDNNPMKAFIELEFFNGVSLIQNIHKSLAGLSKVIRGTNLLTGKVINLASCLLQQTTPSSWLSLWSGPENPTEYIKTVVFKVNEIQKWSNKIDQGSLLKENIDLSDLFHPDTFLSALAQQTAREYGVSMSSLKLQSSWSKGGISGAKLPIKVNALELEGASFDGVRLIACVHDSPSIQVAPICTFAWVPEVSNVLISPSEVRNKEYYVY
jgi:dynein heavy chain 2